MRPLADDTSAEAEAVQVAIWRSWTPQQRLARACELGEFVRQRVREAIRQQYPLISEREARIHFIRRAYGTNSPTRSSVTSVLRTMLDPTTRTALEPVVRLFERHDIEFLIGGSLASIAYGEPRWTWMGSRLSRNHTLA